MSWLLASMELRDWLLITQIVVVGVPAWLAFGIVRRQFKTHTDALTLNAMAVRHQLFFALTDSLSADAHDTAMLHAKDQFDPHVFEERYKDQPQRIRSYLLMKRKYLYLIFSSLLEKGFPVREKAVAEKWIRELAKFHEFHDVHGRQGCYYPEFSHYLSTIVGNAKPTEWMCE